jgi:hypothetical protein
MRRCQLGPGRTTAVARRELVDALPANVREAETKAGRARIASVSNHDDEPPPQTRSLPLEDALGEIDNVLNGLTSSPHMRELRAKAETYRDQIAQCAASSPNDAQRTALGELLDALRANVREAAANVGGGGGS